MKINPNAKLQISHKLYNKSTCLQGIKNINYTIKFSANHQIQPHNFVSPQPTKESKPYICQSLVSI